MSPLGQLVLCLLLCLIAALLLPGVQPYVEDTLKCEPTTPDFGAKVTITLYVKHADYPSACTFSTNGEVIFSSGENKDELKTPICTVTDIRRSSCAWPKGGLGCGCVGNTSEHYIVQYSFRILEEVGDLWHSGSINCVKRSLAPGIAYPPCFTKIQGVSSRNTMATISPETWTMAGSMAAVLLVTLQ